MIIYLASGFSVMNVKGREKELCKRMRVWNRLINFFDVCGTRRNDIRQVIKVKRRKRKIT
jgi:hypothetical protein